MEIILSTLFDKISRFEMTVAEEIRIKRQAIFLAPTSSYSVPG